MMDHEEAISRIFTGSTRPQGRRTNLTPLRLLAADEERTSADAHTRYATDTAEVAKRAIAWLLQQAKAAGAVPAVARVLEDDSAVDPPVLATKKWRRQSKLVNLKHVRYGLREPINITVQVLPDRVIVSDDVIDMYGVGPTVNDALDEYRSALIKFFEWLIRHEESLGGDLPERLAWLRDHLIVTEPGRAEAP